MRNITLLILSGICVNGVHAWLLWSQRNERKWSISVHAAKDKQTYKLYLIGHLLAGMFFFIFAYDFYVRIHDLSWLFWLTSLGLTFEYIQAFFPAKGKTNLTHVVSAFSMFVTYMFVAIFSLFYLPLSSAERYSLLPLMLVIPVFGTIAVLNRNKMYAAQMVAISTFSTIMIAIAAVS
jgi:hypothetical protein